ncbi:hypothetical protein SAMN05192550_3023 [Flavobacterium glycines]|uniref:Uncharacterized protein n=1 Tax=Flavobacterium glycines TaxID=551990 RepID=A0A1G8XNJ8_9FLAO|nr:hypothetical protein SAMN05192550_3023 [Flavobacterium glycines]
MYNSVENMYNLYVSSKKHLFSLKKRFQLFEHRKIKNTFTKNINQKITLN